MSDQNNHNKEISSTLNLNAKRDQYTGEIRKQKREGIINTNRDRIRANDNKMEGEGEEEDEDETLDKLVEEWKNQTFLETDFEDLINAANSEDRLRQLYGFVGLTNLVERVDPENRETTIQFIIDNNVHDALIKALVMHNEPHLQREAANLVQVLTYENDNQALLDKGVLPCLFKLLKSESKMTLEYVFKAIGNIASNPQHRDIILKTLGLHPLLEAVNKVTNPELIKLGARSLSSLCRGKPLPDIKLVEQAIPTLSAIFQKEEDWNVLCDTAAALVLLSRFRSIKIMETNIIPKLIQHMDHQNDQVSIPCVQIIGNFCTLPVGQNDVRSYGSEFLPKLLKLLHSPRSSIRQEVCWLISNITAGTLSDVNFIFDHPYFIDLIIRIVKTDIPEVIREAVWVLSNAMKNLDKNKVFEVIECGVLDCFIYVLDDRDPKTVLIALHGIKNILTLGKLLAVENGDGENKTLELLENKGGIKKIENLQTHENYDVYELAYNTLDTLFELE